MTLTDKLNEVMKELSFLTFDKTNKGQGYKYTSAAGVIHKIHKECEKHGILITTRSEVLNFELCQRKDGKYESHAVVRETVTLFDEVTAEGLPRGGITFQGVGQGKDVGDKAVMKGSTAAYKYAWAHGLALGWDAKDPEEDEVSTKTKPVDTKAEVERLSKAVADAKTLEDLEEIKPAVLAMRRKDGYKEIREAFTSKKEKLS